MTMRVARVPYLNSVPFFRNLALTAGFEFADCAPRELGRRAAAGEIAAGPMAVMDFFRLQETFERLGHFGIAVRGRAHSALLFSRKPLRQLDGAAIDVTSQTSTTVCLLRLLLEQRYNIAPAAYRRVPGIVEGATGLVDPEADALLLIGDDALRFRQTNRIYPFETDLAFEWWLWQHLPFVFALWVARRDVDAQEKRQFELALTRALGLNLNQVPAIAQEYAEVLSIPAEDLSGYLSVFVYRLGRLEEEGLKRFRELVEEHGLIAQETTSV